MSAREEADRPKLQLHHRPVEIERKFLVTNDEWRQLAVRSVRLRDGLIAAYKDRKVRVRIAGDDIATVAVKGPRIGIAQAEFEYEIPIADAERMLSTLWRKSVSSSRMPGKRGMSTFTAAFSKAWLLPKSSLSTRARN